jgi:hypothetical protein
MSFKVENDFLYNGFRCVVIFTSMGHRCGYVGLTKENPLYEKDYGQQCSCLKTSDVAEDDIGKRGIIPLLRQSCEDSDYMTPDCYFDVHGGITYAGGGNNSTYPVESDLWWLGFDCAHCGDGKDYEKVKEYQLMDVNHVNNLIEIDDMYPDIKGTIRTQEYVEQECKNLADQLHAIS